LPVSGLTGRPIRRVEDGRFLAGRGRFVEDVQPPGVLSLAFARSSYAAARLNRVDVEAARSLPGVVAVLTSQDIGDLSDVPVIPLPFAKVPPHPPLAKGRVASVGEPIVAIVAQSVAEARDAAELVEVDYDPLPSVASAEEALQPGAPRVHPELDSNLCYRLARDGGEPQAAFEQADVRVDVRVESPRVAPVALEPRGVVAVVDGDRLTVWISSQNPHGTRADLAHVLGLSEDSLRVIAPDVGGGFGAKSGATPEYILASYLARTLGRPVKWVATRSEDIQITTQGRDMVVYVELAARRDGTLTGLRMRNVANMGARLYSASAIPPTFIMNMATGCYRIPNVHVESLAVFSNTPATGPYRGAGRPESVLAIERGIDRLARELNMDPVELRRKNFVAPDEFPYTTALGAEYDSGDYGRALSKALELANYDQLARERDAARARGELMGIGLSTFVEPSGSVGGETGLVRVEPNGEVTVATGSHSHGQGHETSFAQVVADALQVPMEQVRVLHGDTNDIDRGTGTFASRSMMLGGGAAVTAAGRVLDKARRIAAHLLEATVDDVEVVDGAFAVAGAPSRNVSWREVAAAAHDLKKLPAGETPGLEEREAYDPGRELWPFGTHLAVVRVDQDTGAVHVDRIVAVDDCGNVVNPMIVEGQVQGGIAQAVGQALVERMAFDPGGQLLSGSLGDYALLRAGDMPPLVLDHTATPSPFNPLGAKGVGEAGTNGCPPAIANAVIDALSPLGIKHLDIPFTADRVWAAIQGASQARPSAP
jgi:aerobic carbon-monoxide dehydrogenase large subunit